MICWMSLLESLEITKRVTTLSDFRVRLASYKIFKYLIVLQKKKNQKLLGKIVFKTVSMLASLTLPQNSYFLHCWSCHLILLKKKKSFTNI